MLFRSRSALYAVRSQGLPAAGVWRDNHAARLEQAYSLVRDLASLPRPLVLAGDFNAMDASPVMEIVRASGLRDAFASAGFGWGFTYGHMGRRFGAFLRIDHVLASRDIGIAAARVGGDDASPHRPVIADLLLRRVAAPTPASGPQ